VIRRNIKLAESPSYGKSIFDYAPESNGAKDYGTLADEIHDPVSFRTAVMSEAEEAKSEAVGVGSNTGSSSTPAASSDAASPAKTPESPEPGKKPGDKGPSRDLKLVKAESEGQEVVAGKAPEQHKIDPALAEPAPAATAKTAARALKAQAARDARAAGTQQTRFGSAGAEPRRRPPAKRKASSRRKTASKGKSQSCTSGQVETSAKSEPDESAESSRPAEVSASTTQAMPSIPMIDRTAAVSGTA
jgi:hypothetical protein